MDERAIRRAALVTVRRAILNRVPRGPERDAWLRWVIGISVREESAVPLAVPFKD
jgi:hypothetical protein